MTDKEVIKGCDGCPHKIGINRYRRKAQNQKQELRRLNEKVAEQQAAIERYEEDIERLRTAFIQEVTDRDDAKAEAVKEFAERLKATPMRFLVEYVEYYDKPSIDKMVLFIDDNDIDNLVKEMTEPSLLDKKFGGEQG